MSASGEPLLGLPHTKLTSPERGYAKECPSGTTVSYTSTSSGNGLKALRYTGSGVIENGSHVGETHSIAYAGTDDGPNASQIANAKAATASSEGVPLIIPVAETSIAVPVHLPTSCKFKAGEGIKYGELNKLFNGTMSVARGTGRYRHARGSGLSFTGTIRRSNDAVTVHVNGRMSA